MPTKQRRCPVSSWKGFDARLDRLLAEVDGALGRLRPEKGLTAEEAIAKDPVLNFKRLWEAVLAGRLHPIRDGQEVVWDSPPTFREFMLDHGYEGPPDSTWIHEDAEAWEMDAQ